MALLDRVATLVRANLNDLVDRAENPEKMLKQVILDMENQFIQVKTQVAIALADLHLLEKKKKDNAEKHADWMRKAELAVDKKDDELARAALERAMSFQQVGRQLRSADCRSGDAGRGIEIRAEEAGTEAVEAKAKADLLIAQHRRSRAVSRAADAQLTPDGEHRTFDRMRTKVAREEALGRAKGEILGDDIEGRLHALDREQKIDALLDEIKAKKKLLSA